MIMFYVKINNDRHVSLHEKLNIYSVYDIFLNLEVDYCNFLLLKTNCVEDS